MRYIHDGKLRNRTIDPPSVFVVDEAATAGTGRTDTALKTALLHQRRTTSRDRHHWRWTDR